MSEKEVKDVESKRTRRMDLVQLDESNYEAFFGKVLAASLNGTPEYKIAEALGMSRAMIRKITKSERFATEVKAVGDKAVLDSYNSFRAQLKELGPLAYETLKSNLKEHKMDAFKEWAKLVGLLSDKDESVKDNVIQIVLPGQEQPKTFEVKSDE